MRRASLPMYDLPELAAANRAWWRGLAQAFRAEGLEGVPERLTEGADCEALWRAPELLFSQCCGYPLTHAFRGVLQVVATPVYDAPGCDGADYCSLLVVRRDEPAGALAELRGRRAAVNSLSSQSGYSALRASVAPFARGGRFFGRVIESGGHAASLAMVAAGEADVCAADCVSLTLLARHRPAALEGLRVLGRSPAAPALPYVTRADLGAGDLARLRAGLLAALDDPDLAEARAALLLAGAMVLPEAAYERILELEREAAARGYPEVA